MEMERFASASSAFLSWEEVFVTSSQGRREVQYYVKRREGTSDLAVVGKEKSSKPMSYRYSIRDKFLHSISASTSLLKLRSRREVIDWLNTIVLGSPTHMSSQALGSSLDSKDTCKVDAENSKDVQLRKVSPCTKEFVWLGSPWTCRKRRRHYQSFSRNTVKISVHDFVFVLAEEDKRLVAYLDDMYEDSRGNKMVVVRWFHKIDEVGIVLPRDYNDREIFFSLCLQDLSIECVDGLATVLGPEHNENFLNEAKSSQWEPFVCHRQFDNDEIKPFDITQIEGYWKQAIVRHLCSSSSKDPVKSLPSEDDVKVESNHRDGVEPRLKKRLRRSKDGDLCMRAANKKKKISPCLGTVDFNGSQLGPGGGNDVCNRAAACFAPSRSVEGSVMHKPQQHLTIGSQVEVLSQDSGLRGCWFRALVIKKLKDKVKVQYQDIKDADDDANNLEEWVLSSKVAVPDPVGLRVQGRTTIRPIPPPSGECNVSVVLNAGTLVDVWWHDGWWEGVVLQKETKDKLLVYFPGEKQESVFGFNDLRRSQEWVGNRWEHIKERSDLVTSMLSEHKQKPNMVNTSDVQLGETATCQRSQPVGDVHKGGLSVRNEVKYSKSRVDTLVDKVKELEVVRDISKDALLAQLKWKSSRKRRRVNSIPKLPSVGDKDERSPESTGIHSFDSCFITKSLKVDRDNCKFDMDSPFRTSVVPPLTSLVMSR